MTFEEYAIYCYLLSRVDNRKTSPMLGYSYPSIDEIVAVFNTSKKRVIKNLNSLKAKGFINWEQGSNYSGKCNVYSFTHYSAFQNNLETKLNNEENNLTEKRDKSKPLIDNKDIIDKQDKIDNKDKQDKQDNTDTQEDTNNSFSFNNETNTTQSQTQNQSQQPTYELADEFDELFI